MCKTTLISRNTIKYESTFLQGKKKIYTLKKHSYFISASLISTFLSVLYLNAHKTTTISEDHITTQFSSGTKHTIFSDFVIVFQEKKGVSFLN